MSHSLDEKGESYRLDENCYFCLCKLGLTADSAGLMITSLEKLPNGEDGAELLLVGEGLFFGFAVQVRPSNLTLFLVPVDRNSETNRFRILGTPNTPENWERMTLAVLRLGGWKEPGEKWEEALKSPIELDDLIVCV